MDSQWEKEERLQLGAVAAGREGLALAGLCHGLWLLTQGGWDLLPITSAALILDTMSHSLEEERAWLLWDPSA